MKYELSRKWKEAATTYFKILAQNLPEDDEENHEIFRTADLQGLLIMKQKC
jgi:hypothetical protein